MSKDTKRLGRGIASLVSPSATEANSIIDEPVAAVHDAGVSKTAIQPRFTVIPISSVRCNPAQPRRSFDDASLQSLADSIKSRGALQPIAVRPADGGYELLAGERRLRAASLAGLDSLPAIIRPARDEDLLELALIENVQREDLNPVEKAQAYKNLQVKHGLSHEEIGRRMGEDRATVSNYIRILELHEDILSLIAQGSISMGHAKALLAITDKKTTLSLATRVAAEGWSVRQIEALATKMKKVQSSAGLAEEPRRPTVSDMEQRLSQATGTRVRIKEGRRRHSGRITLEYYTLDDFERIIALLGVAREPD